jgi:hypothetical protein
VSNHSSSIGLEEVVPDGTWEKPADMSQEDWDRMRGTVQSSGTDEVVEQVLGEDKPAGTE